MSHELHQLLLHIDMPVITAISVLFFAFLHSVARLGLAVARRKP